MAKYIFYILISAISVLVLSITRDSMAQEHCVQIPVLEADAIDYAESFCQLSSDMECKPVYIDFGESFDRRAVTDITFCERSLLTSPPSRGISYSKILKHISTIRVLSSLNAPLPQDKCKDLYPNINYVKSSYRYFVYSLKSILI